MKNAPLVIAAILTLVGAGVLPAPVAWASPQSERGDDQAALREYLAGNGFLNRGLNDLAAKEYRSFLQQHPDHDKASAARYGLAVALFRMKDYRGAAEHLDRLAQTESFEFAAEVDLLLGQSRLTMKDYEGAAEALSRVMNVHADHDVADLAAALLAESLYRAGRHDQVASAARFLDDRPESAHRERAELFAGLAEMAQEKYADSAARFKAVLDDFPDGEYAHRVSLLLAQSWHHAGETKRAAAQYEEVIDEGRDEYLPEALYGLGAILRRHDEPDEAGQILDRLISDFPENAVIPVARLERGWAWFDEGRFDEASREFAAAADADPAHDDLARYWIAKSDLRSGRPQDAANRLAGAIEAHPKSPLLAEMHYDRAIALLRLQQRSEAIDALSEFRNRFPEHLLAAEALYLMATTAHELKEYDRSSEYARRFAEAYDSNRLAAEVAYLEAENAFLSGDLDGAAGLYGRFLEKYPEHTQTENATFRLGTALYRLGRNDEAVPVLEAVTDAEETRQEFRSALLALGEIHFAAGDWADAVRHLSQYAAADSDLPDRDLALLKIGLALHRQQNYEEALTAYDALIENHPESAHRIQAVFERGQALVALDRPGEAQAAFEEVLASEDHERFAPWALNHLAAIAMQEDRLEDAAAYYDRMAAVETPDDLRAEAAFQRAQALMAMDALDRAADAFATFAAGFPEDARTPVARAQLAICLARLDRHEDALGAIEEIEARGADYLDADLRITLAYEKAWCRRALDQRDEAKATYRAMLAEHAEHALRQYARIELAELESEDESFEEVAALLKPVIDGEIELPAQLDERARYRYAVSEYELERLETAAEAFESFLDAHPQSALAPTAHLLCGEAYFRLKKYKPSVDHLTAVTANEDADPALEAPALLRLGEAHASLQNWAESEEAFDAYLKRYGDSDLWFQAQFGRGFARENQSRYDEAIASYRDVIDRHRGPTAARAQFQIGECLFAQKKFEEAVSELLKVDILYAYPEWSAAALYEAGRCFEAINQTADAGIQFRSVRDRFPDTKWAQLADERLALLKKTDLPGRGGE